MTHPTEPLPFDETIQNIRRVLDERELSIPLLGIVCGSGLSTLVSKLSDTVQILSSLALVRPPVRSISLARSMPLT